MERINIGPKLYDSVEEAEAEKKKYTPSLSNFRMSGNEYGDIYADDATDGKTYVVGVLREPKDVENAIEHVPDAGIMHDGSIAVDTNVVKAAKEDSESIDLGKNWTPPDLTGEQPEPSGQLIKAPTIKDLVDPFKVFGGGIIHATQFPAWLYARTGLPGSEYMQTQLDKTNAQIADFVGKKQEDYSIVDNLNDFAGGAVIPLPGSAVSRAASKAGKVLGNIVDFLTPGTHVNGTSVFPLAANIAIPTAMVEATNAIADAIHEKQTPSTAQIAQSPSPERSVPSLPVVALDAGSNGGDVNSHIDDYLLQSVAGAGLVGIALASRGRGQRMMNVLGLAPETKPRITSTTDAVLSAAVDRDEPIRRALKNVNTPAAKETLAALDSTATAGSQIARTQNTMLTGVFPNSTVVSGTAPATWLRAFSKLSEQQMRLLNDGLHAADDLNRWANGLPTKFLDPAGNPMPISHPQMLVARAKADPVVAGMMERYHQIMRSVLSYVYDRGLITRQEFARLSVAQSEYVPNIAAQKKETGFAGLGLSIERALNQDMPDGLFAIQQLMQRTNVALPMEQLVDAPTAMMVSVAQAIRLSETNALRRSVVDTLSAQYPDVFKRGVAATDNALMISRNGQHEYWEVTDPVLRVALEFAPLKAYRVLDTVRRSFSTLTAGFGYDAVATALTGLPLQTLASLKYDLTLGLLTKAEGTRFNLADAALSIPSGVARAAYAEVTSQLSQSLASSVMANQRTARALDAVFGPNAAQSIADYMAKAYANSTVAKFTQHGGSVGGSFTPVFNYQNIYSILGRYGRQFNELSDPSVLGGFSLWTKMVYDEARWLHEALQGSVRLHVASQNVGSGMNTAQMDRAIADANALVFDPHRKGTAPGIRSAVPFWNVSVQSLKSTYDAIQRDPTRAAAVVGGLLSSGIGITMITLLTHPEFREEYTQWWTPDQRARGVLLPGKNGPVVFDIDPNLQPAWSAVIESVLAVSGAKSGELWDSNDPLSRGWRDALNLMGPVEWREIWTGAGHAALSAVGRGVPVGPIQGAGLAAMGYRYDLSQGGLVPLGVDPTTPGSPMARENDPIPASAVAALDALVGTGSQLFVDTLRGWSAASREGLPLSEQMQKGVERAAVPMQQRELRMTGLWGLPTRITTSNATAALIREKMNAIEEMRKIVPIEKTGGEFSSVRSGAATPFGAADRTEGVSPELLYIAQYMLQPTRQKVIQGFQQRINGLQAQLRDIEGSTVHVNDRERLRDNIVLGENGILNEQRRMLQLLQSLELGAGHSIGQPDLKLEQVLTKYKK